MNTHTSVRVRGRVKCKSIVLKVTMLKFIVGIWWNVLGHDGNIILGHEVTRTFWVFRILEKLMYELMIWNIDSKMLSKLTFGLYDWEIVGKNN